MNIGRNLQKKQAILDTLPNHGLKYKLEIKLWCLKGHKTKKGNVLFKASL